MTRLAVYSDDPYWSLNGRIYTDQAFVLFLVRLERYLDKLVIMGKLNPTAGRSHYELPPEVGFVELPYYESLMRPVRVLRTMSRVLAVGWHQLNEVDGVLLFGPHPLALAFAGVAAVRRKSIVLGVRQDFPRYVRARHPGRRWIHVAGDVLNLGWRLLARYSPVVAVGPAQAETYSGARTLEIAVALVDKQDIVDERNVRRAYDGPELQMLSVGRLEAEKNPLLLADVLALARRQDQRWQLVVCGDGPLEEDLRERLTELELSEHASLRGYVAQGALREIYRESHCLLHVSWTEGLPQVLFEAFAARLPVVATSVGGIAAATGDAAVLIAPGDALAASVALARVANDPELRARLTAAGVERVSARTLDDEARKVAAFLRSVATDRTPVERSLSLDARIEAEYARYGESGRKLRAWAPDNPGNIAAREELIEALREVAGPQLDGSSPILDLGCGNGSWVHTLSRFTSPERLYGADLLETLLAEARRTVPEAHFVQTDARELPFPSDMFSLVVLFTLLLNVPAGEDTDRVLAEGARVLAPGGVLVIYEPRLPNPLNRRTRTVRRQDIMLPVESRSLTVLPPVARRLGRATPHAYPMLQRISMLRSHRLYWYRKPDSPEFS